MTQWYGPQGDFFHTNGQGGNWVAQANGTTTWVPAPPPTPTPPMDFKSGAKWGDFNQMQRDYFNDPGNANDAEDLYYRSLGLTGNQLSYAKQQAAAIRAKFANDSFAAAGTPGGKAPLFTDWLAQGGSQNLINGYNMLSARSRGANPGAFGTGRMMF